MPPPPNDIEKILSQLRKDFSSRDGFENHTFKTPQKTYSLIKIVLGEGNRLKALISAGIHVDEPGGVETLCSLPESEYAFSNDWELTLLPCLNPYGYEHGIRENHDGKDLNRLFKHVSPPYEVEFAQSFFENKYDVAIELHEDDMSSGYYLYQQCTNPKDVHLGRKILNAVKSYMPINMDKEIDGCTAEQVIIVQNTDHDSMDWWPMALYAISKGTRVCLTLETATEYQMETRVKAHSAAINTALKYFPENI